MGNLVFVNSENFFWKLFFLYSVVIVKSCLSRPANMERACNVSFAPLHYLAKLIPIFDLLERHLLNGRARYYHSVEVAVLDLIEGLVESKHMLGGGVSRFMGSGLQKLKLHLQGGVTYKSCYLCLGGYLLRHEIEHEYFERTDVLGNCAGLGHNEYIFV